MIAPVQTRLLNILLADDGSEHSRAAVNLIAELPHPPDCVVTALRIFTPLQTAEQATMEEHLLATRDLLAQKGLNVRTEFLLGYPSDKILEYAELNHPDLIVLGAKGIRNALGIPLGGVAMHLVEDGRFPVLVVRAKHAGLKKILLVTDGSQCSDFASNYLGAFPLPEGAHITVMHVMPPAIPPVIIEPTLGAVSAHAVYSPEELKAEQVEFEKEGTAILDKTIRTLEAHGLEAETVMVSGDAAEEIINYAREHNIDMIVAGSRGMGAVRGWLMGSVSRKLVHYAGCSVMIARWPQVCEEASHHFVAS
jgi:nucleotide-binding universal stress UspA family protein